jgi:DNA polymerase-4
VRVPPPAGRQRRILHVDMDAFFASVEVLDQPSLAGKAVVVGGTGPRGVVASCTYQARVAGVRSAMPMARARRLCPQAVFLPGRYDRYVEASRQLGALLESVTPLVEPVGLDEAFLDVSGAERLLGPAPRIAQWLRQRVGEELSLSCSVGVASSKLVAKLASEEAKPRATPTGPEPGPGVVVVEAGGEIDFLHPLPVERLPGVGPATGRRLRSMGVLTVGDLAQVPRQALVSALGKALGNHLHQLAWAQDGHPVEPAVAAKSVSHEETYAEDLVSGDRLGRQLVRLADAVAWRLRCQGRAGRTVTLKVRFADFATVTRSRTLSRPTDAAPLIADAACQLLEQVEVSRGVRLLGVAVSGLSPARLEGPQLPLSGPSGWDRASPAVEAVRQRFGPSALGPARLLDSGAGLDLKRRGEAQWGPDRRVVKPSKVRENGS